MKTYKFTIGDTTYEIQAGSTGEALTKANSTLPMPVGFYAWFEGIKPDTFSATTGCWD